MISSVSRTEASDAKISALFLSYSDGSSLSSTIPEADASLNDSPAIEGEPFSSWDTTGPFVMNASASALDAAMTILRSESDDHGPYVLYHAPGSYGHTYITV